MEREAPQRESTADRQAEIENALLAVRQWKLRVEGAIELSGQILREWDTSTNETLYTGAMETILGIYPHELEGPFERWVSLIHPDDRATYRREIQRVVMEGGPFEIEYRMTHKNSKETVVLERGYFVRGAQTNIPVLYSTIADVTEQRKLESRLRRFQRLEAFSQLTGGVAHDFNNMLSVIIGYAQILMEETPDSSENNAFLQEIEKAAFRASSLSNQLLAFNKPPVIKKSTIRVDEVLGELEKMLKRLLGEQVQLAIHSDSTPWSIQVDRSQLEQVFINLAVGARESMPGGGGMDVMVANVERHDAETFGTITVPAGDYLVIKIELKPSAERGAGRNIEKNRNLAAARAVVEQNDGYLVIKQASPKGSSIEIDFPGPGGTPRPPEPAIPPGKARRSARIMLVEDDTAIRHFTRTVLLRLGHNVAEASDGREALALLEQDKTDFPELVVTDMVMPRMGGLELAKTIRERMPETRILLTSGYPEQQAVAQNQAREFAFLKKPFAIGDLISKVGSLLPD
jgi:two-component system, cell cycle sensor histidine kinase and response regulator CckA